MRIYDIKNTKIELHNVLFATTTTEDYDMGRLLLLEDMPNTENDEYILVEGGHCSCYGFDETTWEATVYTRKELEKLLEANDWGVRKELKRFLEGYFYRG